MGIDVAALDGVRTTLEQLRQRCLEGILRPDELVAALSDADARVRILLPADTDAFRHYERKFDEHRQIWTSPFDRFVKQSECIQIIKRLDAVREALKRVTPEFLRSDFSEQVQFYLPEGDRFHARQTLYHLLKRATVSIDIVDGYLDNEVFDFLDAMDGAIALHLVTGPPKGLFTSQLQAFRSIRPVDVRSVTNVHDRFLVIDEQQGWHLGMSINGLGKKAGMINRIDDPTEKARMLSDLDAWWKSGTVL